MRLEDAKAKFVQLWGTLGSQWGINRTMAQLHALLLVEDRALSTEDVMEALQISRGNANQNLRALLNWGLVHKALKPGDRKDYFEAERDIWLVARQIVRERRRRELDPIFEVINDVRQLDDTSAEARRLKRLTHELSELLTFMSQLSDLALRMERSSFLSSFLRFFPSEASKFGAPASPKAPKR